MLDKDLETSNWVFRIENKIVNTTTHNSFNIFKAFNVYEETVETVEETSHKERSSCSGNNVDEDTIQPVRLLPILERDNDK